MPTYALFFSLILPLVAGAAESYSVYAELHRPLSDFPELVYYDRCASPTSKGTPCMNRVSDAGRCQLHR